MMRKPHYDFGRTKVDYQTSNKSKFTSHDLSQATQSKIDAAANGKDVRQSHFLFGTDASEHKQAALNSSRTNSSMAYGGYVKVDSALGATKTNIQIQHNGVAAGQNRFTSSYKCANSL